MLSTLLIDSYTTGAFIVTACHNLLCRKQKKGACYGAFQLLCVFRFFLFIQLFQQLCGLGLL